MARLKNPLKGLLKKKPKKKRIKLGETAFLWEDEKVEGHDFLENMTVATALDMKDVIGFGDMGERLLSKLQDEVRKLPAEDRIKTLELFRKFLVGVKAKEEDTQKSLRMHTIDSFFPAVVKLKDTKKMEKVLTLVANVLQYTGNGSGKNGDFPYANGIGHRAKDLVAELGSLDEKRFNVAIETIYALAPTLDPEMMNYYLDGCFLSIAKALPQVEDKNLKGVVKFATKSAGLFNLDVNGWALDSIVPELLGLNDYKRAGKAIKIAAKHFKNVKQDGKEHMQGRDPSGVAIGELFPMAVTQEDLSRVDKALGILIKNANAFENNSQRDAYLKGVATEAMQIQDLGQMKKVLKIVGDHINKMEYIKEIREMAGTEGITAKKDHTESMGYKGYYIRGVAGDATKVGDPEEVGRILDFLDDYIRHFSIDYEKMYKAINEVMQTISPLVKLGDVEKMRDVTETAKKTIGWNVGGDDYQEFILNYFPKILEVGDVETIKRVLEFTGDHIIGKKSGYPEGGHRKRREHDTMCYNTAVDMCKFLRGVDAEEASKRLDTMLEYNELLSGANLSYTLAAAVEGKADFNEVKEILSAADEALFGLDRQER